LPRPPVPFPIGVIPFKNTSSFGCGGPTLAVCVRALGGVNAAFDISFHFACHVVGKEISDMANKYKRLTLSERKTIGHLLDKNVSLKQIARDMGRLTI
jgi:hypothetical protein